MRKNACAVFRSGSLVSILLLSSLLAWSQVRISGRVTDDTNKPLSAVTVQVLGTATSTQTDAEGAYQITAPSATSTLLFTSVGYTRQEQAINNRTEVNVTMQTAANSMEDVVVVGYGSRRRVEVTGATTSISGESLRSVQTTNLTQALQGRLVGVTA